MLSPAKHVIGEYNTLLAKMSVDRATLVVVAPNLTIMCRPCGDCGFGFLFGFNVWCCQLIDVTNTCIVHYYVLIMCWVIRITHVALESCNMLAICTLLQYGWTRKLKCSPITHPFTFITSHTIR